MNGESETAHDDGRISMHRPSVHPWLLLALAATFLPAGAARAELARCVNGSAAGYPCADVDLLSVLSLQDLGAVRGSDTWGWTDPQTGREVAIYCMTHGTAFVDVTDPERPVHLGTLPVPGTRPVQGDVKVYRDHAYVVGEGADDFGLQVFDLRRLRDVRQPPETFTADAHYTEFGHAHNLAINEESGYAYAVATDTCSGGLRMLDIREPASPRFVGCLAEVGSIHDTQCVSYRGPDPDHRGHEVCVNSGGSSLSIFDVTDKGSPRLLSDIVYDGLGYVHQGWLTEDHAYFLLDDEADEVRNGHNTRTYVFDVRDLESPVLAGFYESATPAIDHNLYVVGDYVFEANYTSGLRILHLDDVASGRLSEVGYLDVVPEDDDARFDGAWTAYPFFASGTVVVSTYNQGLFIVRPTFDFRERCEVALGDPGYCGECGPCAAAQGGCRGDDDCRGELICAEDFGRHFGMTAGVDVCVAPRGVELAYRADELAAVHAQAINNHGQVVGWREYPSGRRSALRYTPGIGLELLAPPGAAGSEALAINDAGDVFGNLVAGGGRRQAGLFRYRDEDGFDLLDKGAGRAFRARFTILDVNGAGDLVGVLRRDRHPRLVPFLYTESTGWIDLSALDARLRATPALAVAINDRADVLLTTEPDPAGDQDTYLLLGGDRLVRLGDLGRGVNVPLGFNDRAQVVGYSETAARERHAYFVQPERPLVDLHRGRFLSSFAGWVTAGGVVGGVFDGEALFTYDRRREQRVKVVARRADFAALLPDGAVFERLEVIDMNERVELVGRVIGRSEEGGSIVRFFHFSPASGVADLQDVLGGAAGAGLGVVEVTALNDRGFLLVRAAGDGADARPVVLAPLVD